MGPGRDGPVLLQHGGAKVESERKGTTRLQAMRVCISSVSMKLIALQLTCGWTIGMCSGAWFRPLPKQMQNQTTS